MFSIKTRLKESSVRAIYCPDEEWNHFYTVLVVWKNLFLSVVNNFYNNAGLQFCFMKLILPKICPWYKQTQWEWFWIWFLTSFFHSRLTFHFRVIMEVAGFVTSDFFWNRLLLVSNSCNMSGQISLWEFFHSSVSTEITIFTSVFILKYTCHIYDAVSLTMFTTSATIWTVNQPS